MDRTKSRLEGVTQWRGRGAGGPGVRAAHTHPRRCLAAGTQTRSSVRPRPGNQPCQVRVALKEDTSASYLTTCLIKFNGLVVPVK